MKTYILSVEKDVSVSEIIHLVENPDIFIALENSVISRVNANRAYLEKRILTTENVHYGINTGFGSLCNVKISDQDLEQLQENLVLSHACGMGEKIPEHICRLILLLKIRNLCYAVSGVRIELIEKLISLYNKNITPVIYEYGSLGASGDLAPLAHLSLVLLGKGHVYYKGTITESEIALEKENIQPIRLKAKEGLALLNGTQFSLAFAAYIVSQSEKLFLLANKIAALSMEAYHCDISPFISSLHRIRPHEGQVKTANYIYNYLKDSELRDEPLVSVQDPYSFRCVPQVHGASYAAIKHASEVVKTEINSVTDNPNVFDLEDMILSGGNFHAQPLALILDYMAIALAELGNISERRVYQLINGDRGLPPFLISEPGLNSGFMIAQYTAASIVSANKQLCTPASIDSIVSSKGQEDHVSMAANAATKCFKILSNLYSLLGIELMTAGQAFDFRRPLKSSTELETLQKVLRAEITFLDQDRLMHDDMVKAESIIKKLIHEIPSEM
ncbi:MAG: histidine ammonia-lyase [Saprospiraceae bacterium]|nr:histidine ammonia-lyase [Saprospiraceae bacterium]